VKTLIVEDDFTSRLLLQEILKGYGPTHIAVNGKEAIDAVTMALDAKEPYNLICMDIKLPEIDGLAALKEIRNLEKAKGLSASDPSRIIMTTSVTEKANILEAVNAQCDYYLVKPIQKKILLRELQRFKLIH
jgi:two-component system, chemotaxis family, chemotaxis protein CheY